MRSLVDEGTPMKVTVVESLTQWWPCRIGAPWRMPDAHYRQRLRSQGSRERTKKG